MGELVERPDEPAREDPRTVGVAVWSPVDPLPVAVFGAAEDAFRLRTPASAVAIGSRRGSSDGSSGRSSKGERGRKSQPTWTWQWPRDICLIRGTISGLVQLRIRCGLAVVTVVCRAQKTQNRLYVQLAASTPFCHHPQPSFIRCTQSRGDNLPPDPA